MKALILSLALVFSASALAGEPKAPLFQGVAENVATAMYGQPGDAVSLELVDMANTEETVKEVWSVSLSNGAQHGSALYEVSVEQKVGGAEEGEEVASVKVRYLGGT